MKQIRRLPVRMPISCAVTDLDRGLQANWDPQISVDNDFSGCPVNYVNDGYRRVRSKCLHQLPTRHFIKVGPSHRKASTHLTEPNEVDNVERAATMVRAHDTELIEEILLPNVVRQALQEVLPIPSRPESEALHLDVVITHRCVPIWRTVEVEVNKLLQICTHDLIRVDKNDLLEVHGEQNVEEQDLVCPDYPLLFLLRAEP